MKNKSFKLLSLILAILLLSNNIALAASNKIPYISNGKTKFYTVSIDKIAVRTTEHSVTGESGSYPVGTGSIFYQKNGVQEIKKIQGSSYSSYWIGRGSISSGVLLYGTTSVKINGSYKTVMEYFQ